MATLFFSVLPSFKEFVSTFKLQTQHGVIYTTIFVLEPIPNGYHLAWMPRTSRGTTQAAVR